LICFSSVFDIKSLTLLEELNSPAYKIASLESLHFPLIKEVCKTNKPIIISTGTLSISEIDELLKFLKKIKYEKFIIMHCVSDYPTKNKDVNLKFISYLRKKYNCLIGFSDHTSSLGAAISSVSYGACLIEKHLKLDNSQKSLDHQFSIDPSEMEKMIAETNNAWESIGKLKKVITKGEKLVKKYRRSIYCFKTIKKGERFSKENIKIIRPGKGMDPKNYEFLLGKKASKKIELGQAIKLKLISKSS
jgi:N-acetylneuraminate synthase